MPTYTLLPGTTSEVPTDVAGATFTNLGSSTVSYSDSQDALSLPEGTLAGGATATLYGTVFLGVPRSGVRTDVQVLPLAASSSSTAAVLLPFNGRGVPGFPRAHRVFTSAVSVSAVAQRTYRTKHIAQIAGTQVRFVYHNMSLDAAGPPNAITIRAGYETPLGTPYPLTFNGGSRNVTIEANQFIVSDPIGLTVGIGDVMWSRAAVTVTTATVDSLPVGSLFGLPANNEGWIDGDATLTASPALTSNAFLYGPVAVLIEKPTGAYKTVAVFGDSVANGNGEPSSQGGGGGFTGRAMDPTTCTYLHVSRGGDSLNGTVARNAAARLVRYKLVTGFGNALIHYGTNDRNSGRTNVQMQADLQTLCVDLKAFGMRVFVCTIPPRTTGNPDFSTDAGQIPVVGEAERLAFNAFLRGPLPAWIDGVFDTAVTVESVTNPGNWKAGLTSDGTHPGTGHINMAAAIDTTRFA